MKLATRSVHVAGIVRDPCEAWTKQIARNLTDAEGWLRGVKYLIVDRDPLFSLGLRERAGISVVRLPARSPNMNAYCERWIRSIREECLNRIIPLGEAHLRWAIGEFVAHYHAERNHQGLEGALIEPEPGVGSNVGRIACRERVGGLLNYYYRRAS